MKDTQERKEEKQHKIVALSRSLDGERRFSGFGSILRSGAGKREEGAAAASEGAFPFFRERERERERCFLQV